MEDFTNESLGGLEATIRALALSPLSAAVSSISSSSALINAQAPLISVSLLNAAGLSTNVNDPVMRSSENPAGGMNQANRAMKMLTNKAYQLIADPNLNGMPIRTARIEVSRQVDVSRQQVIDQEEGNKKYASDNACPHPRHWTLTGYLTSFVDFIDANLYVKPTLLLQEAYLDTCALQRIPLWFKDNSCRYYRVYLEKYSISSEPNAVNGRGVQLELSEYDPLVVDELPAGSLTSIYMGEAEV